MTKSYSKEQMDAALTTASDRAVQLATKAERRRCLAHVAAAHNYVEGDRKTVLAVKKHLTNCIKTGN